MHAPWSSGGVIWIEIINQHSTREVQCYGHVPRVSCQVRICVNNKNVCQLSLVTCAERAVLTRRNVWSMKVILDRVVPSCLQSQGHGESLAAGRADARQLTLEEIMYPPPSWEGTPARRNSPKVCPVNLDDDFSDEDRSEGGYSAAAVDESVMSAVSRASVRSYSVSRRVSFRSPDESDVFIIPARKDSDEEDEDDDDESSDGEPRRR